MRTVGIIALVVALLIPVGITAQEGGPKVDPQNLAGPELKLFGLDKTLPVINDRRSTPYPEMEKEVKKNVEKWGKGDQRWDNFRGAPIGTVLATFLEDILRVTLEDFHVVNNRPIHTFIQMMLPPVEIEWDCGIHYQYLGFEVGTCYWVYFSFNPACLFMWWETRSLVEYYYPSYKMDHSGQELASLYIDNILGESVWIPLNEAVFYPLAAQSAAMTTNVVHMLTKIRMMLAGYQIEDPDTIQADTDAVNAIKDETEEDHRHYAPHMSKNYGRTIFEPLDLLTEMIDHIPHTARFHYFGTDLPLGYLYSKMFLLNFLPLHDEWTTKLASLLIKGPRRCVMNNKIEHEDSSGKKDGAKSPLFVDIAKPEHYLLVSPPIEDAKDKPEEEICIDEIGEKFFFTDDVRLHTTDATYQSLWKTLKLFHYIFQLEDEKGRENPRSDKNMLRHSFLRDYDKFTVLRSPELRQETVRAGRIDDLHYRNIKMKNSGGGGKKELQYDKSNIITPKASHENSFEVWPLYKGCWGAKAKEPHFFIEMMRPPLPWPPLIWLLWFPPEMPGTLRFF